MNSVNYFKDMFESIPDYKKIVSLLFLIQNDRNLLKVGFSKNDLNLINLEFKNILLEEFENYLDYIKNQEQSLLEKFLNK